MTKRAGGGVCVLSIILIKVMKLVLLHLDIRLWPAVGFVLFKETRISTLHHIHLWVEQCRVVRDIPCPILISKVTRPILHIPNRVQSQELPYDYI